MTPLAAGLARKQRGMETMECVDRDCVCLMRLYGVARSEALGQVSTDDLRMIVQDGHMLPPKRPQSWGCIFRGKHWMYLGQEMSSHASNHGRRITVWRWVD